MPIPPGPISGASESRNRLMMNFPYRQISIRVWHELGRRDPGWSHTEADGGPAQQRQSVGEQLWRVLGVDH